MAEEKRYLDYDGLAYLVEKLTNKIQAVAGGGSGDCLPLSGGTLTGEVRMGETGFAVTAEGHIVLPSGVEIY